MNPLYPTVPIGNLCWARTNLRTGKYLNGDFIPTGITDSAWSQTTTGAYALYHHKPAYDAIYGKLYNFYAAADPRGLCPAGWRLATDSDWNKLVKYLDADADTTFDGIGGGHYTQVAGIVIKDTTEKIPAKKPQSTSQNTSDIDRCYICRLYGLYPLHSRVHASRHFVPTRLGLCPKGQCAGV